MALHKVLSHNASPAQTPGFMPDMRYLFLPPRWEERMCEECLGLVRVGRFYSLFSCF